MSKNRQKGTSFETAILPWIKVLWPAAKRTGSADYGGGDFEGTEDVIIEAKNQREMRLGPWMRQTHAAVERNGKRFGILIHKRKMFGPAGAYVTMSLEDFVAFVVEERQMPEGSLPADLYPVSDPEPEVVM